MYEIVIDDCVMISGSYILLSIVTYTQLIPPVLPLSPEIPPPPPPGTSGGASIMTGVDNYLLSRAVTVFTILSAETPAQWSQIHLVSAPHIAPFTLILIPTTPTLSRLAFYGSHHSELPEETQIIAFIDKARLFSSQLRIICRVLVVVAPDENFKSLF